MLNDITQVMLTIGLEFNPGKLRWLCNRWADVDDSSCLVFNGVSILRSESIKILGSIFRADLQERAAVEHRIQAAWACYKKWSYILESSARLSCRVTLCVKTVLRSLLWGLQTTRALKKDAATKLLACQKYMIKRMMKVKRKPMAGTNRLEPWIDYNIRSMRNAGRIIDFYQVSVLHILDKTKREWSSHIARMGTEHRPPHLLKAIMFWRPRAWWIDQEIFNEITDDPVRHPVYLGRPLRFEDQFSSNWCSVLSEIN